MCLNDMIEGLCDNDGDVRCVTAKALQPTTDFLLDNYQQFVSFKRSYKDQINHLILG